MVEIPDSHPRYESLKTRESLVEGVEKGMTSKAGLIAHGRGEMFDYLLGEQTIEPAERAERKVLAEMLDAEDPVISVNGNVAALVPADIVSLADRTGAKLEVNLFHRTKERIQNIEEELKKHGAEKVYGKKADANIPGLDHDRALCDEEGIFSADVVLVPLEDGDRTKALKDMGKTVLAIDLNPLSRTSKTAHITIMDNIIRAVPNMLDLDPLYDDFDNAENLSKTLDFMCERLKSLSEEMRP
ncbi:MAG: 4-phosphopantoate--beta-alanine ligase [Candidatus Natronoplasma sp.]